MYISKKADMFYINETIPNMLFYNQMFPLNSILLAPYLKFASNSPTELLQLPN